MVSVMGIPVAPSAASIETLFRPLPENQVSKVSARTRWTIYGHLRRHQWQQVEG